MRVLRVLLSGRWDRRMKDPERENKKKRIIITTFLQAIRYQLEKSGDKIEKIEEIDGQMWAETINPIKSIDSVLAHICHSLVHSINFCFAFPFISYKTEINSFTFFYSYQ